MQVDPLKSPSRGGDTEMKRLIGSALVALALTLSGISAFAATVHQPTKHVAALPTELTGEITNIRGQILMLKDEAGKESMIRATDPKMLEGLKVGDRVTVKLENGKATSIQKLESEPAGNTTENAPSGDTGGSAPEAK
jgi:Cu/Ag efflux protein CusF